jgi:DUF4097 and DUF4098 domain-containing protein YvlB
MRICLIFLYSLIASNLPALETSTMAVAAPDAPYVEREEKQFQFYPGGKMTIQSGVPGSIRIIGWNKGSVRVETEKISRCLSPEKAKSAIGQFPVRVRWNQTSANIQVDGVPAEDDALEFNLTVYVPEGRTDIKTTLGRGNIFVESVNGWVEVTTGQGSLGVSAMSGYFSGNTEKGDIRVEMSGTRWSGLEFAATTRVGSIDLQLPVEYSAALKLETLNGNVRVDYPPTIVDGEPVPLHVGIRKKAQALDAAVGVGGAPVKLISRAGDIRLSIKE